MKTRLLFCLVLLGLHMLPCDLRAQAPNLGTAANFTLFTSVGDFTNLGTSIVTGDVGTNAGAYNSTPPILLAGQMHVVDAASAQAALDLDVAYAALVGTTCGTVLGTTMGSGQVLTPGVYCAGAATTLNGSLILDALGDANALFIFKVDGQFVATTGASVSLINGAMPCNIYWQVNGAFNLQVDASFVGTALVNGAIAFQGGAILKGNVLTRQGAVDLQTITAEICNPPLLPVDLVFFSAEAQPSQEMVQLKWQTSMETNSAFFRIERWNGSGDFVTLGEVDAANFSTQLQNYTFRDGQPQTGANLYRLSQYDLNGKLQSSNLQEVSYFAAGTSVLLSPNPCSDYLNIHLLQALPLAGYGLQISNAMGEVVLNETVHSASARLSVAFLHPGIYMYQTRLAGQVQEMGKLMVYR